MTRPATFTCAWCRREKTLARTGRMPRFCSDSCRRAPASAENGLATARYHLAAAQRTIAYYEEQLRLYRAAIAPETIVHVLVDTGRASNLAACDEPFANGQRGSQNRDDATCRACRVMFGLRPDAETGAA